jgi:hypothetical protein
LRDLEFFDLKPMAFQQEKKEIFDKVDGLIALDDLMQKENVQIVKFDNSNLTENQKYLIARSYLTYKDIVAQGDFSKGYMEGMLEMMRNLGVDFVYQNGTVMFGPEYEKGRVFHYSEFQEKE